VAGGETETIFSFYTSDIPGTYLVQVEGITDDGQPFYAEETFTVKFRK
jgi:hypothetical protein